MSAAPVRRAVVGIEDLARGALVRVSRRRRRSGPRSAGEPLVFTFTVDTEVSMGGALDDPSLAPVGADRRIWGRTPRGDAGIDQFMDVFDEFGFKATFFFETMGKNLVGEEELARAAGHIADRGHDVQLHIHPEFKVDIDALREGRAKERPADMAAYSLDEQREMIREGAEDLLRWTGSEPTAFRAGGYGASSTTLRALAMEGLYVDSSYSEWAIEKGYCKIDNDVQLNDVATLSSGVLEVPVTNMRTRGPRAGLRPFELSSLNGSEMTAVLDDMYDLGYRSCCSVTHSFRLLRVKDVQYRDTALDPFNLHRLRVLCRHLAAHKDRFSVKSLREIPSQTWKRAVSPPIARPRYPEPPLWSSVGRLALQAIKDRGAR